MEDINKVIEANDNIKNNFFKEIIAYITELNFDNLNFEFIEKEAKRDLKKKIKKNNINENQVEENKILINKEIKLYNEYKDKYVKIVAKNDEILSQNKNYMTMLDKEIGKLNSSKSLLNTIKAKNEELIKNYEETHNNKNEKYNKITADLNEKLKEFSTETETKKNKLLITEKKIELLNENLVKLDKEYASKVKEIDEEVLKKNNELNAFMENIDDAILNLENKLNENKDYNSEEDNISKQLLLISEIENRNNVYQEKINKFAEDNDSYSNRINKKVEGIKKAIDANEKKLKLHKEDNKKCIDNLLVIIKEQHDLAKKYRNIVNKNNVLINIINKKSK